jgi:hypothetical protein
LIGKLRNRGAYTAGLGKKQIFSGKSFAEPGHF